MFHEKQEGQLCAQHALNNLLQGEFFSPVDLAQIARDLDHAELEALLAGATNQEQEDIEKTFQENRESHNYDDSGFFSVQVITKALQVWNLNIIPIGSSDSIAKKAKDSPEEEVAFILNLAEHWFTLRKFGGSKDRWYNLNSVNSEPQHVSKIYLGMLLQQMKAEGYSIFVVVGKLSESEADQYCQLIPIPPKEALVKNSKAIKNAQKNVHNGDDDLQKALRMSLGQDQQSDQNDDDLSAAIKASMMDPGMDQESLALAISASLQASSSSNDTESNHVEKRPADENNGKLSVEEIRRRRLERFG